MSGLTLMVQGSTGIVELARPDKFNCLSRAMIDGLAGALDRFEADPAVRSVLLRAQGKAFCAGADLAEVKGLRADPAALRAFFERGHAVMRRIEASDLPVVAAVQGVCLAGGLELMMCCDVAFAARSARFGDQHAQFGLFPGWGGTQRLPRLIGMRRALDLMFSASWLDAPTARDWGLVNHVVEDGELSAAAEAYCATLGTRSRAALAAMKRVGRAAADLDLAQGLALETETAVELILKDDVAEGIRAFEEKRPPRFA